MATVAVHCCAALGSWHSPAVDRELGVLRGRGQARATICVCSPDQPRACPGWSCRSIAERILAGQVEESRGGDDHHGESGGPHGHGVAMVRDVAHHRRHPLGRGPAIARYTPPASGHARQRQSEQRNPVEPRPGLGRADGEIAGRRSPRCAGWPRSRRQAMLRVVKAPLKVTSLVIARGCIGGTSTTQVIPPASSLPASETVAPAGVSTKRWSPRPAARLRDCSAPSRHRPCRSHRATALEP